MRALRLQGPDSSTLGHIARNSEGSRQRSSSLATSSSLRSPYALRRLRKASNEERKVVA